MPNGPKGLKYESAFLKQLGQVIHEDRSRVIDARPTADALIKREETDDDGSPVRGSMNAMHEKISHFLKELVSEKWRIPLADSELDSGIADLDADFHDSEELKMAGSESKSMNIQSLTKGHRTSPKAHMITSSKDKEHELERIRVLEALATVSRYLVNLNQRRVGSAPTTTKVENSSMSGLEIPKDNDPDQGYVSFHSFILSAS